jgi:folylpolyglutamate synthase/dihydropteroate synthase
MDFHELKGMTVAKLRGVAKEAGITGSSQMRKDDLLKEICDQLKIEMHEHHEVVGVDKASIKRRIQALKEQRDVALDAHNHQELKDVRRQIHKLKRRIHRATV